MRRRHSNGEKLNRNINGRELDSKKTRLELKRPGKTQVGWRKPPTKAPTKVETRSAPKETTQEPTCSESKRLLRVGLSPPGCRQNLARSCAASTRVHAHSMSHSSSSHAPGCARHCSPIVCRRPRPQLSPYARSNCPTKLARTVRLADWMRRCWAVISEGVPGWKHVG
jgi:hypothetical protein